MDWIGREWDHNGREERKGMKENGWERKRNGIEMRGRKKGTDQKENK
jgi:hypothetical protein